VVLLFCVLGLRDAGFSILQVGGYWMAASAAGSTGSTGSAGSAGGAGSAGSAKTARVREELSVLGCEACTNTPAVARMDTLTLTRDV
jgi:hypothetical protein